MINSLDKIIADVSQEIETHKTAITKKSIGTVVEIRDEVVLMEGLDSARYGELLNFGSGVIGMIVDLTDTVGAIIFGNYQQIKQGAQVSAMNEIFSIPVGEEYIGRVVDGIGTPIDQGKKIFSKVRLLVDSIAPGVIERQSVDTSLHTGIKAIDGLIPIGRGQRQLIIGDRRTGKTSIATDTILAQKGGDVICIYCAIGQRRSNVATTVELLRSSGAMEYSIVVAATSSDSAAMQYVAPYVATTIGEYFLQKGRDVLVIYDDLSKHAWAYRQISLVLRRPSGREAYPGDVFYLHSRLLERACRLNQKHGGGSLTALPIIETQEGDVSAYIPTNVISITDGQIVVDSDLFNAGIRPAINVGASVSRIGGAAQVSAMKMVAGKLKFDLAQYRELAAFAQFESDLDSETKKFRWRGARMTQLLKQGVHAPYDLAHQVVIFWAGTAGYLDSISVNKVSQFEKEYIVFLEAHQKKLFTEINKTKKIGETAEKTLKSATDSFMKLFSEQ